MSKAQPTNELREDKELMRLASLVGTDAKNPKGKLAEYVEALIISNKQRLLQTLMESKTVAYALENETPVVQVSVIQNKLEGLS